MFSGKPLNGDWVPREYEQPDRRKILSRTKKICVFQKNKVALK